MAAGGVHQLTLKTPPPPQKQASDPRLLDQEGVAGSEHPRISKEPQQLRVPTPPPPGSGWSLTSGQVPTPKPPG